MKMRTEHDALGSLEIPQESLWGIHTERAIQNFKISGRRMPEVLIRALAVVKKAAARSNYELKLLTSDQTQAISQACDEILNGEHSESFPLDGLQGGAGTSLHMNVNEVIANRALQILGKTLGDYEVIHPLHHVNLHQSTNDVFPTAVRIAMLWELKDLAPVIAKLQGVMQEKEKEFSKILKIGRTELQNAVPMTQGAEFGAFAEAFGRDRWRIFKCEERIRQINLGGTAIGTGLGAPTAYIFRVVEVLREITGLSLTPFENRVDGTANADAFVEVSGILKAHAVNLIKIAEDLRKMNLLKEIRLPALQAGSSLMPGKINPVLLEAVIQTGMKVLANDYLVAECVSRGTFQISEFMPLFASAMLETLDILKHINVLFADYASKIKSNPEACKKYFETAQEILTAFVPSLGYERCTEILHEFERSGSTHFLDFLEEKIGKEAVKKQLSPEMLMQLGHRHA